MDFDPTHAAHDETRERAARPEDLTRLFVDRANAGDADGLAALYEEDAVMAYPPGQTTVGRTAIRELWAEVLAHRPRFEPEAPLPTLVSGGIALTSTPPRDGSGARAQVVRRQADGTWLRLLDQPEFVPPAGGEPAADSAARTAGGFAGGERSTGVTGADRSVRVAGSEG